MSMCHKAYVLDYAVFSAHLAPILLHALASGDQSALRRFIDANAGVLTLPWEGASLPTDWRSVLERGDTHELGDLALTKFYDANADCGLQEHWRSLDDRLDPEVRRSLLGEPFGPPENPFDPGRMGSYFQSPGVVRQARDSLAPFTWAELAPFKKALSRAGCSGLGLYVTF